MFSSAFSFVVLDNVEDESELGIVARVVYERDALGASANIPSHAVIPQGILRAGRRLRALGVDVDLFMERVLIQSGGIVQKCSPPFQWCGYKNGDPLKKVGHRSHDCASFSM